MSTYGTLWEQVRHERDMTESEKAKLAALRGGARQRSR